MYAELIEKSENERIEFERKLNAEKQKWQEPLNVSKLEKQMMEMKMKEQMIKNGKKSNEKNGKMWCKIKLRRKKYTISICKWKDSFKRKVKRSRKINPFRRRIKTRSKRNIQSSVAETYKNSSKIELWNSVSKITIAFNSKFIYRTIIQYIQLIQFIEFVQFTQFIQFI